MVTREKVIGRLCYKGRNPYVVPGLGVFRDKDIASLQMEQPLNLGRRGCRSHERNSRSDMVVLISIHVVAETNRVFVLPRVLVHIADAHIGDGTKLPHLPMRRHATKPLNAGGIVDGVVLGMT